MSKVLKTYYVREDIFNKILEREKYNLKLVDKLDKYLTGYTNKETVVYDKESGELICKEIILDIFCNNICTPTTWKQVRLIKSNDIETETDEIPGGTYCWNYMMMLLKKKYSPDEIEAIFQAHREPKEFDDIQFHYDWQNESQNVQKIRNTYKYDINGAHLDALIYLFPKCKEDLIKLYNKRKESKIYKMLPNYFVGMLVPRGYEQTYWYIVHRTTRILKAAIKKVGGRLVYSNTDSLVISDPVKKLDISKDLGEFKLEFQGDTYIYNGAENYTIYKFGNELKGSCLCTVRDKFDLENGIVVRYKNKVDTELKIRRAVNVEVIKVNVEEV